MYKHTFGELNLRYGIHKHENQLCNTNMMFAVHFNSSLFSSFFWTPTAMTFAFATCLSYFLDQYFAPVLDNVSPVCFRHPLVKCYIFVLMIPIHLFLHDDQSKDETLWLFRNYRPVRWHSIVQSVIRAYRIMLIKRNALFVTQGTAWNAYHLRRMTINIYENIQMIGSVKHV